MKIPVYNGAQESPVVGPQSRAVAPQQSDTGRQFQELGAAVSNAGRVGARIAMDMQQEANQTRVSDAMNKAIAERIRLTHDPEVGFSNIKGNDALVRPDDKSLTDEYGGKFDDSLKKLGGELGNDAQRRAFTQQAQQLSTQFRGQVQEHVSGEYKRVQLSTQAGTIQVAQDQAALDWDKPQLLEQSRGAIIAATTKAGKLQGLSDPEITANVVEQLSQAHTSVVTQALQNNNVDYAKSYKEQIDTELTPQARAHLNASLKVGDNMQQAQSFADSVMAKGESLSSALAQARQKFTGDQEETVVREIKSRFSDQQAAKALANQNLTQGAWTQMMDKGSLTPTTEAALLQNNPEELRQINDWKSASEARRIRDINKEATDNPETYYALRLLAVNNPASFADPSMTNLLKYKPELSNEQFNSLVNLQSSISKQDALTSQSERMVKAVLQSTKEDIRSAGIDLNAEPGSTKANEAAKFMGTLTLAIDTANQASIDAGQGPLKPEQSKVIAMNMVRQGVEQGSGIFGIGKTKKLGYQIASDTENNKTYIAAEYGDIPVNIRDDLIKSYRSAKGLTESQQLTSEQRAEIERAYTIGKQKGRF